MKKIFQNPNDPVKPNRVTMSKVHVHDDEDEDEDDIYDAVLNYRIAHGWYDPWYKKIRFRYTFQRTPFYLLPALVWSPYLKAIGIGIGRHTWQISFNRFGNDDEHK